MKNPATENPRRKRLLLWLSPLLVGLTLFLLGQWAGAWLESTGGRKLLQRELSKGLGLPVTLQGEYGLRLLPRLEIAGTGLVVGEKSGESVFLYSRNFSAEVELVPFIKKQLRIASISIGEGFIDLANLSSQGGTVPAAGDTSPTTPTALPDVASLKVENFSVRYAESHYWVDIGEMVLGKFRAGTPANLTLRAGVFRDESMQVAVDLRGSLLVEPADFSTELHIDDMQIALDDRHIDGISGRWRWDRNADSVDGQMDWQEASRSASSRLELVLDDPVSGALQVEYRSEMFAAPITLALGLQILQESVSLKNVVLALNSQRIDGNGCVRFDEPAGLHLDLVAEDLDLGALSPIIPEGESGESDLSFVHAIKLRVHTAQMAGALAEDVLVQAGSEPECASAPETLP